MDKNRGSVTIFMLLITTTFFVFAGLLIDLSRITLANYAVASAAQSATRSLMANYDKDLVADYGLYAIQNTTINDTNKIFRNYVEKNLNFTDKDSGIFKNFSMLKLKTTDIVSTAVELKDPIMQSDIFKGQVTEYMKYKGPLLAIDETLAKLKDFLTNKISTSLLGKVDDAKKKTDVVVDKSRLVANKITKANLVVAKPNLMAKVDFGKWWANNKKGITTTFVNKGTKTIATVIWDEIETTALGDLGELETLVNDVEKELKQLEQSLYISEQSLSSIDTSSLNNSDNAYSNDVNNYVDSTYTKPQEISNNLTNIRTSMETAKSNVKTLSEKYKVQAMDEKCIKTIMATFYLYEEGKCDLGELNIAYSEFLSKITAENIKNSLPPTITEENKVGFAKLMQEKADVCIDNMNQTLQSIKNINIQSIIDIKIPEPKENYEKKSEQQADEKKTEDSIANLNTGLQQLVKDISPYEVNRNSTIPPLVETLLKVFARNSSPLTQCVEFAQGAVEAFSPGNITYNFLLTSYIMDKTSCLTSSTRRDHFFNFGETEYIINDYNIESLNTVQAIADVTKFRFCINFLYYFFYESPPPAEGITLLIKSAYSATRAGISTSIDMLNLIVIGGSCDLVPNVKIPVTYRDHLTFMVFFKAGKQANLINTMQATLQKRDSIRGSTEKTNADITQMYTTAVTNVEVKCDLVFLKLLGFEHINSLNFKQGNYIVRKKVIFGY